MKVVKTICATNPHRCHLYVYGWLGRIKGRVIYEGRGFVAYKGSKFKLVGHGTDFYGLCDMLLDELGIVKIQNAPKALQ